MIMEILFIVEKIEDTNNKIIFGQISLTHHNQHFLI